MTIKTLLILSLFHASIIMGKEIIRKDKVKLYSNETYEVENISCQNLIISGDVTLKFPEKRQDKNNSKVVFINCDHVHFEKYSKLVTHSNLEIRAAFMSGDITIEGQRPNINGGEKKAGSEGENGASGRNGNAGVSARDAHMGNSADVGGTGEGGENGKNGKNGKDGERGENGKKNVKLALLVDRFHPESRVVVTSIGGKGGRGGHGGAAGDGGKGGRGGNGGKGGDSTRGLRSAAPGGGGGRGGDGGDGGNGGNGGNGGDGGDGGDVYILVNTSKSPISEIIFEEIDIDNLRTDNKKVPANVQITNSGGNKGSPGLVGRGGRGGLGGRGGTGGPSGHGKTFYHGDKSAGGFGDDGNDGKDGQEGSPGAYGEDGKNGLIAQNVTGFTKLEEFEGFSFKTSKAKKSFFLNSIQREKPLEMTALKINPENIIRIKI